MKIYQLVGIIILGFILIDYCKKCSSKTIYDSNSNSNGGANINKPGDILYPLENTGFVLNPPMKEYLNTVDKISSGELLIINPVQVNDLVE